MKASRTYRNAAANVEKSNVGACVAIHRATTHRFLGGRWPNLSRESLAFQELFCPFGEELYFDCWMSDVLNSGLLEEDEVHAWRVTALCFMSAIAADRERQSVPNR